MAISVAFFCLSLSTKKEGLIMSKQTFALRGTICYSNSPTELSITENAYLVCENGLCAGVFTELPEKYAGIPCTDFGEELIIPRSDRPASSCPTVYFPWNRNGSGTAGLAEHHHLPAGGTLRRHRLLPEKPIRFLQKI